MQKTDIDMKGVYVCRILLVLNPSANSILLVSQSGGCGSVFWKALRERAEAQVRPSIQRICKTAPASKKFISADHTPPIA
jgi:Icc-related predicted phosphoesterase